jgi:hypothetical protein
VHGLFLLWNLVSHDYFIVSTMLVFAALWCRHECGMNPRSDGCTLFLEGKPSSRSSFRAILQCHATWFSRKIERVSEWSGPLYSARDREVSSERKILLGLDCCKTTTRVVDYGPIVDRYHQPISERKRRMIVFAVLPYVDGLFLLWNLVSRESFIVSTTMLVLAALWCRHECGMNQRSDGCTVCNEKIENGGQLTTIVTTDE